MFLILKYKLFEKEMCGLQIQKIPNHFLDPILRTFPDFKITSATSGLMESGDGLFPASIICLIFVPLKSILSVWGQTLSFDIHRIYCNRKRTWRTSARSLCPEFLEYLLGSEWMIIASNACMIAPYDEMSASVVLPDNGMEIASLPCIAHLCLEIPSTPCLGIIISISTS